MGEVVCYYSQATRDCASADKNILDIDGPAYGGQTRHNIACQQGVFHGDVQNLYTRKDVSFDPAPKDAPVIPPRCAIPQLHNADTRSEQGIGCVLAKARKQ